MVAALDACPSIRRVWRFISGLAESSLSLSGSCMTRRGIECSVYKSKARLRLHYNICSSSFSFVSTVSAPGALEAFAVSTSSALTVSCEEASAVSDSLRSINDSPSGVGGASLGPSREYNLRHQLYPRDSQVTTYSIYGPPSINRPVLSVLMLSKSTLVAWCSCIFHQDPSSRRM